MTHAAGESSPGSLPAGTYAVVLAAEGPEQLAKLQDALEAASVPHRAIVENDPPYSGQLMAIGLAPAPKSTLKGLLRRCQLLR